MLRKHSVVLLIAAAMLGLWGFGTQNASAAKTVPANMRGSWYQNGGEEQGTILRIKMSATTYSISLGHFVGDRFVGNWNANKTLKLAKKVKRNKTFTLAKKGKKYVIKTNMSDWGPINSTLWVRKKHLRFDWQKKFKGKIVAGIQLGNLTKHTDPAGYFFQLFGGNDQ